MFLGTPKSWWIGMAIVFVVGLYFVAAGTGGILGNVVGVLMIIAGILIFAAAPMRYGRDKRQKETPTPPSAVAAPIVPPSPPRPRAAIEARDADEV
jgi:hypothetical protein